MCAAEHSSKAEFSTLAELSEAGFGLRRPPWPHCFGVEVNGPAVPAMNGGDKRQHGQLRALALPFPPPAA